MGRAHPTFPLVWIYLERLTLASQRHEETPPIPPFARGGSRGALPPSQGGDQEGRTSLRPPPYEGGSGEVEASARPRGRTTSAIHSLTALETAAHPRVAARVNSTPRRWETVAEAFSCAGRRPQAREPRGTDHRAGDGGPVGRANGRSPASTGAERSTPSHESRGEDRVKRSDRHASRVARLAAATVAIRVPSPELPSRSGPFRPGGGRRGRRIPRLRAPVRAAPRAFSPTLKIDTSARADSFL